MAERAAIGMQVMDAFNHRAFDEILLHLHADYEATWPHAHLSGPECVDHEMAILAALPDLQMVVERAVETADGALLEITAKGTQTGPWISADGHVFPPSGRTVELPMALVMVFEGDLLRSERLYFDQLRLHDAMRILPATDR